MKKRIALSIVFLSLAAKPLVAQEDSKLPRKASALIEQLNDWEQERRIKFEAELDAKRNQVAQLLRRHQEEATKAGDLDGAIAIREAIEALSGNADQKEPAGAPTDTKAESDQLPVGSVWVSIDSKTTLTIAKRNGESFDATLIAGENTRREIRGKVKGNQLSWRSKDVRAVSGGKGGDNVGTINGERIDLVWTTPGGQGGKFTLKRSSDSK